MLVARRTLLLLVLSALVACSDDPEPPPEDTSAQTGDVAPDPDTLLPGDIVDPADIVDPDAADIAEPDAADIAEPDAADIAEPDAADIAEPDAGDTSVPPDLNLTASVELTAPDPNAQLSGDVMASAVALSSTGTIDRVVVHWSDLGLAACEDAAPKASGSTFSCSLDASAVPPGAHALVAVAHIGSVFVASAPVSVTVTGDQSDGLITLPGIVIPPNGQAAGDYDIGNPFAVTPAATAANGTFELAVRAGGVTVSVATPLDAADADTNDLLAVTPIVPGDVSGPPPVIVFSAESTAMALLFLHPALTHGHATTVRALLELGPQLPQVQALTTRVQTTWATTSDPLSTAAFQSDMNAALLALLAVAPGAKLPETGGPMGDIGVARWHELDRQGQMIAEFDKFAGTVNFRSLIGHPLSAVLEFSRVDLQAHGPGAALELTSAGVFDSLINFNGCAGEPTFYPQFIAVDGTTQSTIVVDDSLGGYVDLYGTVTDTLIDFWVDVISSQFDDDLTPDVEQLEGQVAMSPSIPGAYVARAFNGKLDAGTECGEVQFAWQTYPTQMKYALILNLTGGVSDWFNLFIPFDDILGTCIQSAFDNALDSVNDPDLVPNADGTASDAGKDAAISTTTQIADGLHACAEVVFDDIIAGAQDKVVGKIAKKGKKISRIAHVFVKKGWFDAIGDFFNAAGSAAALGVLVERVIALYGGPTLNPLYRMQSPMDTILFRVGNPFEPIVVDVDAGTGLKPLEAAQANKLPVDLPGLGAGSVLTLRGEGFAAEPGHPGQTRVVYTDQRGTQKVVWGGITKEGSEGIQLLASPVPAGLAGTVSVAVAGPGQGFDCGTILVVEPHIEAVSPEAVFDVVDDFGGNYVPEVELRGYGFLPKQFEVLLGADGAAMQVDVAKSTDTRLFARTNDGTAPGQYALHLATTLTGIGTLDMGATLGVLGPPVVDGIDPASLGGGELFQLGGKNFGVQRDAVALEANGTRLELYALDPVGSPTANGWAGSITTVLALNFSPLVALPESVEGVIRTPAGEASFTIPIGDQQRPGLSRGITIVEPAGWDTAIAFAQGLTQPSATFQYQAEGAGPEGEGPPWLCNNTPALDTWEFGALNPGAIVAVTAPPATAADPGKCDYKCHDFLLDFQGKPCPSSWAGFDADQIHDTISNGPGLTQLTPKTVESLQWADFNLNVKSGGGLHLVGIQGKQSHLTVTLTIDAIDVPAGTPVLTLENMTGANLILSLKGGDPTQCDLGVQIINSRDVTILAQPIQGCKTGVHIDAQSERISIVGSVTNYGPGGVGVHVDGASGVGMFSMVTTAGGDGATGAEALEAGAVGVRIDNGADHTSVEFTTCSGNEKGVEILDATQVTVQGRIGSGLSPFTGVASSNVVGVDIVGPVEGVTIGGDPLQGEEIVFPDGKKLADRVTVIVQNGQAIPAGSSVQQGAGIRIQQATDVTIKTSLIGVSKYWNSGWGNAVGILAIGQPNGTPSNIRIVGNHIGHNQEAGILLDGVTGGVVIDNNLFAGSPDTPVGDQTFQNEFPSFEPFLSGGACSEGTYDSAGAATLDSGLTLSNSAVAGIWVLGSEDVLISHAALLTDGIRVGRQRARRPHGRHRVGCGR